MTVATSRASPRHDDSLGPAHEDGEGVRTTITSDMARTGEAHDVVAYQSGQGWSGWGQNMDWGRLK
jgi:hypothetical protein